MVTALVGNGIVPAAYIGTLFHKIAFDQNGFSIKHIILFFRGAWIFGEYLDAYIARRCQADFFAVQR